MTVRDMKELTEKLGLLKAKIKALTTEADDMTSELKDALGFKEKGYEVESEHFIASLSAVKTLDIIESKLWDLTTPEEYRKCVKPSITACRKVLSESTLIQVSEEKIGESKLNLKERK